MKFDYLREFVAAAASDEMQLCAKALGISPSVLSKHIKTMEKELGVPLFLRSRKTQLTPYGKSLLPYAQELVRVQDDYLRDLGEPIEPAAAQLIVGISPMQYRELSGQILENFILQHPHEVQLREADNDLLCQLVAEGEMDLAFVRTPPELHRSTELMYLPFCSDAMVVSLPADHPLARSASVTLKDLQHERIILRSDKSTLSRILKQECDALGIRPNIIYSNSSYASYDMVRRGEGVALYMAAPAERKRKQTQIVYVPISPPVTSFIDVVFRPRHLTDMGLRLLQYVQRSSVSWYRSSENDGD